MILLVIILFIVLLWVIYTRKENFRCNVPFRTSNLCFVDKYHICMNQIPDKLYCQDVANSQCTVPPTVSENYPGPVECVHCQY